MAYGIPALAGRLLNPLVRAGQRILPKANPRFAPASMVDLVTNPKTYSGLADDASNALGRALPPQFRGAGFQNVPTSALGALDDAAKAPFAGPARQQILDTASKNFARKAGSGTVRVPVIPTGGQRVVPGTVKMLDDVVNSSLKTPGALNNLGGLMSGAKNALKRAPVLSAAAGAYDAYNQVQEGRDPLDAIGRATFGTLGGMTGTTFGTLGGLITGPGAVITGVGGGIGGYNLGTGLYDSLKPGFMEYIEDPARNQGAPSASDMMSGRRAPAPRPRPEMQDNRPEQGADLDMDTIRREAATAQAQNKNKKQEQERQQKPPVGPNPNYQLDPRPRVQAPPPGAPPNAPTLIPGTPIPQMPSPAARPYAPADQSGNIGATYANGTSTMPNANVANTVLPPNAEQILQANPMQIYEQARKAAVGQDQSAMNKVRDLGLAIHRQQFPTLYKSDNSVPGSMTVKDEDEALTEIEPSQIDQSLLGIYSGQQPVLDPNKFLDLQLSGRIIR